MIRKRSKSPFLRILSRMIAVVFLLSLCENMFFLQIAYAKETGTAYIANTNSHYAHPITGEIEDSGNNEAIGQGMTESVTYKTALIEQIDSGGMFATVRLSMMDNISNVRFWTQEWGDSGWSKVSSSIMQENAGGDYTSDYRIEIPNENAVIKVQFYVAPMGRDIIYFIYFSDFVEGSSDFLVSIESATQTDTTTTTEDNNDTTQSSQTPSIASNNSTTTTTTSQNSSISNQTSKTSKAANNKEVTENKNSKKTASQLIEEADGLILSDESLLKDESSDSETDTMAQEDTNYQKVPALPWLLVFQCLIILTVPGAMAGILLLLVMTIQRKRERDYE